MTDDDMRTKTLDELHQIVAEGEAKKERAEREFRLAVVQSLMRIEDLLNSWCAPVANPSGSKEVSE